MRVSLTDPQFEFVSTDEPYPLMVAGYGAGKSHAAINRAIRLKLQYPKQSVAYYLPTYDFVRTIGFPRFSELLEKMGLPYKLNKTDATIQFGPFGELLFRTMDTPERIIGYEVADSIVDELDTLPTEKARDVWNKIVARNRQKKPDGKANTIGTVSTPEGFKFLYEMWAKNPKPGYQIIKASTYSNAHNLPDGYIDSLKAIYPDNLLSAYLEGEFVNLTSGSVYPEFDRNGNYSDATIKEGEALHWGMDFNVGKMAAVCWVLRDQNPVAVAELTDVFDTPAMCLHLKKYKDKGHAIYVYPDASGGARKSANASTSDLAILRQHGFTVLNNPRNPAVKDRVLATNRLIYRDGIRALKVNTDACPGLTEAFEKQAYDKHGEPDKTAGLDHVIDAATYFIAYKFPIQQASSQVRILGL